MQKDFFALSTLSPLDGRYHSQLSQVAKYFSEFSFIYHRVKVEIEYLLFLSDQQLIPEISDLQHEQILKISTQFTIEQAQQIKDIEKEIKHDVKAIEYFIRQELEKSSIPLSHYVHIGLTSEDANSLALSLMIKEGRDEGLLPLLDELLKQLAQMSGEYKNSVLLARTHGQPAVPTTMGKELLVFAVRLHQELQLLSFLPIEAKLSGAVGTYAAQQAAFPQVDWVELSQKFISSLGLKPGVLTTQIVSAESYSRVFSSLLRINVILLDLDQDLWRYISDGYFIQQKSKNQVGSSTMPHKINPIDFENSEGNLGLANSLFTFFIQKLPVSRLQRDLSDSTVKRSIGSAFGYAYLGYSSLFKGLQKITLNEERLQKDLDQHWEVITEAFQVILRVNGDTEGYEKLKTFSQGKKITKEEIGHFIDSLSVNFEVKKQLKKITPQNYIGLAPKIVDIALTTITKYLKGKA